MTNNEVTHHASRITHHAPRTTHRAPRTTHRAPRTTHHAPRITFTLNGAPVTIEIDPAKPLLKVLRDDLGLTGTKQACDMEGECGACTVIVDGEPQRSCLILAGEIAGRSVTTIEGLGTAERPHPLQIAFLEMGAVQCGYCTPGMLLSAAALLDRAPQPSRAEIVTALQGNLCRCTGYGRIIAAVERAAVMMNDAGKHTVCKRRTTNDAFVGGRVVGGDLTRHKGWDRVSGATRYAEDIVMPEMHFVQVVRSPHFHARVLALDPASALAIPGVVRVLTAADVPGENSLGGYSVDEHLLAPVGGKVRMVGDAVALVIAATIEAAEAGAAVVRVEYELLPHTFEVEGALEPGAIAIHGRAEDDVPLRLRESTPHASASAPTGNLLAAHDVCTGGIAAALAESDAVVEATYQTTWQAHMAMEREAAVGYVDEAGRLAVICASHEPHWNRGYLATILGLPLEQLRVITPPIGGSFGGKQDVWPMAATALALYHLRKPVKLAYTRREVMEATSKRHPYTMRVKVGVRQLPPGASGVEPSGGLFASARPAEASTPVGWLFTGMSIDITVNTGAYDSAGRYIADYAVTASVGPYRWQAVEAHSRVLYSNGPKAGQFRGFGSPQPIFALECLLDELCQQVGADPLEFRLANALRPGEPTGLGYPPEETLGIREVLEALRGDYREMADRAANFNADPRNVNRRRGVGLAAMMYRFGKFGVARSQAEAALGLDGRITVFSSAAEFGQGIETVFTQLAAESLGVSRGVLQLVNADTADTLDGDVVGASRATYWVGSAVADASRRLRAAILSTAAELLDRAPDGLTLADDAVCALDDSTCRVPLAVIAAEMARTGQSRRLRGTIDLTRRFPEDRQAAYLPMFLTGAHVVEVEVDLETGQAKVKLVAAAHDVGKAINPRDAVGQVEGGVMMGIGSALIEEFVPGQSRGYSSYAMPTITATPEICVHLVEVPGRYSAFGVKGLGEAVAIPTQPAVINAVSRAIGGRIRRIPATSERILAVIRGER
ncbi:MAG: molybdopterin-dependent oxidoreductase [Chloroflexi bacterium]|nr:molybdopterin-dependent oxidoreductase [Chloroflexota bacterium]